MAKTHELKTWPDQWRALARGEKPFEVRKDDRGFEVGDHLILNEFDPRPGADQSGRAVDAWITYKLPGGQFGIEEGFCVLGLRFPAKELLPNPFSDSLTAKDLIQRIGEFGAWASALGLDSEEASKASKSAMDAFLGRTDGGDN